jgi:putative salt-induced outer membrane protein YdiY
VVSGARTVDPPRTSVNQKAHRHSSIRRAPNASAIYTAGTNSTLKLSDTVDVTDDLAWVGTFSRAADWQLGHAIALTATLTDALSLKVSNGVRYANVPAFGFRTDVMTSVAVVATFKSSK